MARNQAVFLECVRSRERLELAQQRAANRFAEFLVVCCDHKNGQRYVSLSEARTVLRAFDDAARAHALWFLGNLLDDDDGWFRLGKPFIQRAWPREQKYRTPAVAQSLAALAERAGDHFEDVVKTIKPLLVPVDQLDMTIHRALRDGDSSLAKRFPEATLTLLDHLVADVPASLPYELREILETVGDATSALRKDPRWKRLKRIAESV